MSRLGTPRLHLRTTDSTNARARELAAAGAPHGLLVTADAQSAGRGRQGRTWTAPMGRSLLLSLVVRDPGPLLSLAAGVAVAEVAEDLDSDRRTPAIKWPNDVLFDGVKVAGILVEGRPQDNWAVLGIGLNLAVRLDELATELRPRAASLGLSPDAREPVLNRLLDALAVALAASPAETLARVRARDALRGRPVAWDGGQGTAAGVDADGRLLVDAAGRRIALSAGEVHLRRGR